MAITATLLEVGGGALLALPILLVLALRRGLRPARERAREPR